MRPVVSRPARSQAARSLRFVGLACVLAVAASACGGGIPAPQVETPQGRAFFPLVPDSIDDVGLAPSVAVDGQGLPMISYFGFPATLEEGEIPVARPVGSPFLTTGDGDNAGAVLLANLAPDQIWTRGAIAQPRETPSGVPVPFGPVAEPSLESLTPEQAAGTDLAIDGTDIHATWATDEGVFYGLGPDPFEIGPVEQTPGAGPPSIVVDEAGTPLVAYTVAGDRTEVRVAERVGENWSVTTVATLSGCGEGCPPATGLALLGGEPLVVTADAESGDVIAAHRQEGTWTSEMVATDATGGASISAAGDTAAIAYYTQAGVALASGGPGSWSTEEVAPLAEGTGDQTGTAAVPTPPTTSVAVDSQEATWVAWQDPVGIHLASSGDEGFEEVDLPDTSGGVTPSLAVTEDGASGYLAWYDTAEGDLRLGTYGEIEDLLIAAPTPLPSPRSAAPSRTAARTGNRPRHHGARHGVRPDLPGRPAGGAFTINFNNRDARRRPTTSRSRSMRRARSKIRSSRARLITGPDTDRVQRPRDRGGRLLLPLRHPPDQMTGTLAVVDGGGGNGGGGNGDGGGG